ncbi:related to Glucose-signaling factor 2 [Saccharomycodes ludwigii]|uniref:Related to Glucose-signaling factor 2 n=1 Tax=Saccharomycodes ludwigii TaxID=36035 RepID=A0A376B6E8_9ASCO|nr:hypothetical protein SCDLUD_000438 [Saccharomycodes ludwigii]KAH3902846.1 hypothetical protein SCDLUD_000438 [Saccharomycodes ludwigii]SSD60277.1 related to Glucose-signaling factor 2 [Saccharomycodes ludwigii]
MEVFIRLNDDIERDFAFQVDKNGKFNDKIMHLFDTENGIGSFMNLKPSIFHKSKPVGFYKSIHPGYLTDNGSLLFPLDADEKEFLEELDLGNVEICKQLWPHQLIVPIWEKSGLAIFIYCAFFAFWLYTDLPDFISPTPGICLTNQVSRLVKYIVESFGYIQLAKVLENEIKPNSANKLAQIIFFSCHLFKVIFISFFFYTGFFNPISFNPLVFINTRKGALHKEKIKNILTEYGWIGVRRATFDEYYTDYYKYVVEKAGGQVEAYKQGILKSFSKPGVLLGKGEGFQTPIDKRFTIDTFEAMKIEKKFYLSEKYFLTVEKILKKDIDSLGENMGEIVKLLRNFRRYGLFNSNDEIKEMVQIRKSIEPDDESESKPEQEKKEQ